MVHCARGTLGSSRDPSPGLSSRCICHLGNPSRLVSSQVFVCCVHRMAPVAQTSSVERLVVLVEYGHTAGKNPATCRTGGKTFPRPNVTLSDFLPARGEKKKRNTSQNVSLVMSRRSSWVSWSDSREQSAPSGEETVMELARSLTNPRSTGRSEQTTNCGTLSRTCRRALLRFVCASCFFVHISEG